MNWYLGFIDWSFCFTNKFFPLPICTCKLDGGGGCSVHVYAAINVVDADLCTVLGQI